MNEDPNHKSAQNYELLIRVDEQLKSLTKKVDQLADTTNQRVAVLETTKLEKEEAARMMAEAKAVHDDHESRLRKLEDSVKEIKTQIRTWGATIALILALVEILLRFI